MRLPAAAHTDQPWQIHELRPRLHVLDVWALPTPGGPDDFPQLVRLATAFDPARSGPYLVRLLFAIRLKLGALLRLDGPRADGFPFTPILETDREWAGELVNKTVRGVLHLGWVQADDGSFHGQLAVLVQPNGLFGRAYLAAIAPFRHRIVYPALVADFARRWSQPPLRSGRGEST